MVTINLEKDRDVVWLSIEGLDVEISREAFTQLCFGLAKFDEGNDTVKEIRLDVADADFDEYESDGE